MQNIYTFRLNDDNVSLASSEVEYKTVPITFLKDLNEHILNFSSSHDKVSIPSDVIKILQNLLEKLDLKHVQDQFICLICACQSAYEFYSDNKDIVENELYKEFESESKEFQLLLKALKYHIEGKHQSERTIKLGFSKEIIKLKNRWVIQDVYDILLLHYKLRAEDFEIRKNKILEEHKNFDAKKGGDYIKNNIINCFYNFLSTDLTSNQRLKIVGTFLRICQIPTGTTEPLLFSDLQETINDIEVNNLRHFITRPVNFFK